MLEAKALLSRTYRGWQTCKSCTAEHILGQLAFNSLTAGARNAWTRFNAGNTEPPTFEHITAFFDQCIADLDGDRCPPATLSKFKAPPLSPKANSKPTRSAHIHTVRSIDTAHRPQPCVFCKEEGHRNYQCPAFKVLDVESRRQRANFLQVCYNCCPPDIGQGTVPAMAGAGSAMANTTHCFISSPNLKLLHQPQMLLPQL